MLERKMLSGLNKVISILMISAVSVSCSKPVPKEEGSDDSGFTAPSVATKKVNQLVLAQLPFENRQDFDDSKRGFIGQVPNLTITSIDESEIWNMPEYDFVQYQGENGNAPASVNPSLWRQAALNNQHGLFKLQQGIYQIRNFDLANMTIIEGEKGWILVDPLTAKETAKEAIEFAWQELGNRPISAIIFTHSHIDHFGGVQGVLELLPKAQKNNLDIIAPKGFMEEAVSENLIAGAAMGRRAGYMYGKYLPRTERGHVGTGLGKGPAFGSMGIVEPNVIVDENTKTSVIDGVTFEFQYVPESEAPAELTFYLPESKAFSGAELVSKTMHNLYTLRGAKVRDANKWSSYIEEAKVLFKEAELYFGSHHWPVWGKDNIQNFLTIQSDTYKYIHDQTVRLLNAGHTPKEIAELIELPASLQQDFSNRGYYGTLKHNAKAVYQAYMGWFTANPATLDPLPEPQAAKRYVQAMGGADATIAHAQTLLNKVNDLDVDEVNKEYRWIAQLLNHVVLAEPDNIDAKSLLAKTYDQLGYMAESAPWRDFYLSGAFELRHGVQEAGLSPKTMKEVLKQTPAEKFLEVLAIRLNGPKADGKSLTIKFNFTDVNKQYLLTLNNSVLRHAQANEETAADATLNITQSLFLTLVTKEASVKDVLFSDDLSVDGSTLDLLSFFSLLDNPLGDFNIVTP